MDGKGSKKNEEEDEQAKERGAVEKILITEKYV